MISKKYTIRLPEDIYNQYEKIAKKQNTTVSKIIKDVLVYHKNDKEKKKKKIHKQRFNILRVLTQTSNDIRTIVKFLEKLENNGELTYSKAMHYLMLLDNIETQQHIFLQIAKRGKNDN